MKILLADDHQLFLGGFRHLVAMLDAHAEILTVSEAARIPSMLKENPDLDLMTLDLNMPGLDSCQLLKSIRQQKMLIPVVIVSASENPLEIQCAMSAGASGFISKATDTRQMLAALQSVLEGNIHLPIDMRRSIKAMQRERNHLQTLSQRQQDILELLPGGKSNRAIAEQLHISEHTVKSHLQAIFQILAVTNRMECVRRAEQLNLLKPDTA